MAYARVLSAISLSAWFSWVRRVSERGCGERVRMCCGKMVGLRVRTSGAPTPSTTTTADAEVTVPTGFFVLLLVLGATSRIRFDPCVHAEVTVPTGSIVQLMMLRATRRTRFDPCVRTQKETQAAAPR